MRKTLLISGYVLLSIYGLLQFLLAVQVFQPNLLIALVFLLAGVGILVGLYLRNWIIFGIGVLLSLAGPLAVGLTGIEPFELIHHIVRLVIVAGMIALLVAGGWPRRTAAQQAKLSPSAAK